MKQLFIIVLLMPVFLYANKPERAIFAGGCFWCMEADFEHYQQLEGGIISVTSGYDGGSKANPSYELVSSGTTHYKEVVEVVYNPEKISYEQLVKFFFMHIDPTVKNRQFCDVGAQYGSAIYYLNDTQKQQAMRVLNEVKKELKVNIYTEILASTHFYPAEQYHQEYYKKNPLRYKFYRWNCGRDKRIQAVWGSKKLG